MPTSYAGDSGLAFPEVRSATVAASDTVSTPGGTVAGDLLVAVLWSRTDTGAGTPVHTLQGGWTSFVLNQSASGGGNAATLSLAYKLAVGGVEAAKAFDSDIGGEYAGVWVIKKDTFYTGGSPIFAHSTSAVVTSSPPEVTNIASHERTLSLGLGAWHLTPAADVAVTAPTRWILGATLSGSNDAELALAWRYFPEAVSLGASSFGDDVTPNIVGQGYVLLKHKSWTISADVTTWQANVPVPIKGDARTDAICAPAWRRCADREQFNKERLPLRQSFFATGSPYWDYPVTAYSNFDHTVTSGGFIDVSGCKPGDKLLVSVEFTFEMVSTSANWDAGIVTIDDFGGYAVQNPDNMFGIVKGAKWDAPTGAAPPWPAEGLDLRLSYRTTVIHTVTLPGVTRLTFGYQMGSQITNRFKIYEFGMQVVRYPF